MRFRLDEEGSRTSVNLDVESLSAITHATDPDDQWIPVWMEGTRQVRRVPFEVALSASVTWDDVTGEPDTYPPTLPIMIADVDGLQEALDDIGAVDDLQDAALAALQALLDDLEDRVTVLEDIVPAAFVFVDVTDAALSTEYTSNTITVTDIGYSSPISITGGRTQSTAVPIRHRPGRFMRAT